jgi:O-antigen ligase/tetratricopeptide (TPR) repeat protein
MRLKEFLKPENIIKFLLQAAIFVPLVLTPFTIYPTHHGKTVVFQIFVSAAFLLYLVLIAKGRAEKPKLTAVFWVLSGYLAIRIIAGFFGVNPEKSFWGNESRMGGNFTWLNFGIFFYLLTQFFKEKRDWIKLFKISLLVSFIASIAAVMERFGISPFGWWEEQTSGRVSGLLGNPIPFASYILFSIFLGFFVISEELKKKNILTLLGLGLITGLNILTLFWSGTRGAIYIFYCSFPVFFVLAGLLSKKKAVKAITAVAVAVCVVALVVLSFGFGDEFLAKISRAETAETRLINWQVALNGWTDNVKTFLLGYGTENYDRVFDKFYNPKFIEYSFYETVGDKPHNILFEVATASGLLGLVVYLALFVVILFSIYKIYKKEKVSRMGAIFLLLSFSTYLGQNLFEFDSTNVLLVFFLTMAFVSGMNSELDGKKLKISKPAVYLIFILIIILSWFGTIKPLKASYYASKAITQEAINDKTLVTLKEDWGEFARKALEADSVFEDEIRVHIANNVFKFDAGEQFNPKTDLDVLSILYEKMKESVKKHPDTYAYKHRFAQIQSMMGQYVDKKYFDESEQTFKELDAENPDRQAVGLAWAQMRLLRGDAGGAVGILEKLSQKNPDSAAIAWYYGLGKAASGDEDGGLVEMERSLSLGEYALTFPSSIGVLASMWEERGQFDKIIYLYSESIKTAKIEKRSAEEMASLLTHLAATYAKAGKIEDAIRTAEEAVDYDPSLEQAAIDFINSLKR